MKETKTKILKSLVAEGMKMRYGDNPDRKVKLRILWELKHIIDAGFEGHYIMVFRLFRHYAESEKISYWGRGAMCSSIVCYCLGLSETDPLRFGLHSARFVNDEPPKFQFDIEASLYDEFMQGAQDLLAANAKDYDIEIVRRCLSRDVTPMAYLSRKRGAPEPENLDDEIAREALIRPDMMDLYDAYMRRKSDGLWTRHGGHLDEILASTCGFLVYQEQMLDILRQLFHVSGIKANQIRLSIQRGNAGQVGAYKQELLAHLEDLTEKKAEWLWQILTSNPRAFLKAHAVSRVLAKYHFDGSFPYIIRFPRARE